MNNINLRPNEQKMLRTFRVLFGRNNGYTDDLGYGTLNEQIDQGKRDARLTLAIFSILFVVMTTLSKSMTAGPVRGHTVSVY